MDETAEGRPPRPGESRAEGAAPDKAKNSAELEKLRQAAEINLLVWIRTCLAMMGFGFVLARFGIFLHDLAEAGRVHLRRPPGLSLAAGTFLIVLGVVLLSAAVALHWRLVGRLRRGEQPAIGGPWSLGVVGALVLAALGMVLASYLAFIQ